MKEDLLESLVNLNGISGDEHDVRDFIIKHTKKHIKNVKVDKMGNVIAVHKGQKPAIMLMAHMDEIGLMISSIESKGRMYLSTIGGIDPVILIGQRVNIYGRKGKVRGIITNNEVLNDRETTKKIEIQDLFIYTGLDKKQLKEMGVEIGSYVSFASSSHYRTLGGTDHIISGKALDDRVGCYILLEVMKNLKTKNEINFVFTVQEEVGLYGAQTSVFNLNPDYAIAVDATGHEDENETRLLGNGPVVTIKDSELLGNKCLNEHLEDTAKKLKVPLQLEVSEAGTTDATSVFASKGGIPSTVLGIPVGNLHTTIGMASRKDIDIAIRVLKEFLKNPPNKCWT